MANPLASVAPSLRFAHRHVLSMQDFAVSDILTVLDLAEHYFAATPEQTKREARLRGKTVVNLFMENSTRTRTSFELAAKRLGADAVNINAAASSVTKGETLLDTARNLEAMAPEVVVIRSPYGGAPAMVARRLEAAVINAGDGQHEHPTQALTDLATIRKEKGRIAGLTVTIVGDIVHSRVARSNIVALSKLGAAVRVCAPASLLPVGLRDIGGETTASAVQLTDRLEDALDGADVVMMLRVQTERMQHEAPRFPNAREYARMWGLSEARLRGAKPDVMVMHPGPMNRGVEISPHVADGRNSFVLDQVSWGVAVRMALLHLVCDVQGQ